jgi:hypothetical protein
VTREESKEAVLTEWYKLPVWRRRNSQDAADFAQIMLTSRPDLTEFECLFDRFLILRAWLIAEQHAQPSVNGKHGGRGKAHR